MHAKLSFNSRSRASSIDRQVLDMYSEIFLHAKFSHQTRVLFNSMEEKVNW